MGGPLCGALEGRYFTAEVIATALRLDRDAVNDLLDERLALSEQHKDGLVEEVGVVPVPDQGEQERSLWRYRFTSSLVRSTLLQYGLTRRERSRFGREVAMALQSCYGDRVVQVLPRAARLYSIAGLPEQALKTQRAAEGQMPNSVLREEARNIETADLSGASYAEKRRALVVLLDVAESVWRAGPLDEALAFARHAQVLARQLTDHSAEAHALVLLGIIESYTGEPDAARGHLERALSICRDRGFRDQEAHALMHLGWVAAMTDRESESRELLEESLRIWRHMDAPSEQIAVLLLQMNIAHRRGDSTSFAEAIDGIQKVGLVYATAVQLAQLAEAQGVALFEHGRYDEALAHYETARRYWQRTVAPANR
jgi:tetratricopeptide (TPR) repeat protein